MESAQRLLTHEVDTPSIALYFANTPHQPSHAEGPQGVGGTVQIEAPSKFSLLCKGFMAKKTQIRRYPPDTLIQAPYNLIHICIYLQKTPIKRIEDIRGFKRAKVYRIRLKPLGA